MPQLQAYLGLGGLYNYFNQSINHVYLSTQTQYILFPATSSIRTHHSCFSIICSGVGHGADLVPPGLRVNP